MKDNIPYQFYFYRNPYSNETGIKVESMQLFFKDNSTAIRAGRDRAKQAGWRLYEIKYCLTNEIVFSMNTKQVATKFVMTIMQFAEKGDYEDNGIDKTEENAKDAAIEVIENIIIPQINYFSNDVDVLTETLFWKEVKEQIIKIDLH